ncbi:hypothetical protein EC988_002484 [Linderina pennispora]|nr:hypothetical protein EC988_002484 [Linderina pennispora]
MSQVRQISRWVALGGGLTYGYVHSCTLRNDAETKRINDKYAHQLTLIEEAKKKFAEKNSSGSTESFNFEDPNFDADKWFKHIESKY